MPGRGYVVVSGTIGGQYARGSIIPDKAFPEERLAHWVARGAIRPATDEDVTAAVGVQPSGAPRDIGSLNEVLTPTQFASLSAAAREAEIQATKDRLELLESTHDEATDREMELAKAQESAMANSAAALGIMPGTVTGTGVLVPGDVEPGDTSLATGAASGQARSEAGVEPTDEEKREAAETSSTVRKPRGTVGL